MTALLIWKRGMHLAHTLYAAVEAAGLGQTDAGRQIRKCALAVPSLVDESFSDFRKNDPFVSMDQAEACLASMREVLTSEPLASAWSEAEIKLLLAEIDALSVAFKTYRQKLEKHEEISS